MTGNGRRRTFLVGAVAALCSSALISACGGGGNGTPASTNASQTETSSSPTRTNATQKTGTNATQGGFDASNFGNPTTGASQFMPLKPGTQWVRQGFVNVGHRHLPHQVVTTVTDVSKQIDGVRTVAVVDQDTNGGQIAEQSIDWVAADKEGNVWLLGSYTESYNGGQFVNASDASLAGVKGSKPGILMLANPQMGTAPYTEDTVPGIESPSAQVAKTGQSQCVPF